MRIAEEIEQQLHERAKSPKQQIVVAYNGAVGGVRGAIKNMSRAEKIMRAEGAEMKGRSLQDVSRALRTLEKWLSTFGNGRKKEEESVEESGPQSRQIPKSILRKIFKHMNNTVDHTHDAEASAEEAMEQELPDHFLTRGTVDPDLIDDVVGMWERSTGGIRGSARR